MSDFMGISPVQAMNEIMHDLGHLVMAFGQTPPEQRNTSEYLRAVDGCMETAQALLTATFLAVTIGQGVPKEALKELADWQDIRKQLESEADRTARQKQLLERFALSPRDLAQDVGSLVMGEIASKGIDGITAEVKAAMKAMIAQAAKEDYGIVTEGRELIADPECPQELRDFIAEMLEGL